MNNNKSYKFTLLMLFFILTALIYANFNILKKNLKSLNSMQLHDDITIQNQFHGVNYSDIINLSNKNSGIKGIKFTNSSENNDLISIELQYAGNYNDFSVFLKELENDKSLYSLNEINIENQDNERLIVNLKLDFIRN